MAMKKAVKGIRKIHVFAAVALAIGLVAVFGDKGLLDLYNLRKERDNIVADNTFLESENRGLEEKIALLKTDKRYIGQIARKELGMLGKDEVVYRLEEKKQPL